MGTDGLGEAGGVVYRGSVPSGGMSCGNWLAWAFMNFAKATTRGGEVHTRDAGSGDGTARRKRCLAHSQGGYPKAACMKVSSSEEHLGQVERCNYPTIR